MEDDVVHETCAECGFDASTEPRHALSSRLRELADQWGRILSTTEAGPLRQRPRAEVWSALEYAVHTARVVEYWIQAIDALTRGERISMDEESYPDADRMPFNDTPIATAADDLRHQLLRLAEWNETATDDQWTAPLRMADERAEAIWHRSGIPDAAAALRHALHDAQHHLDDVERGLAAVSAP